MKRLKSQPAGLWRGVRLRRVAACAEPDAPPRLVSLPASWDEPAAAALAALAPGRAPVTLEAAARAWIDPIAASAARDGLDPDLGEALHALLLSRRAAPTAPLWRGAPSEAPGFVLNLPAFFDPSTGFDMAGLEQAARQTAIAAARACPDAVRLAVGFADLAGLLACLGVDYDSQAARDTATAIAALIRAAADEASAWLADRLGARFGAGPVPPSPATTALPGLAERAAAAQRRAAALGERRHIATTTITAPGAPDALLGVETGGFAPAFAPLSDSGHLTRAAQAWLAATGQSAEAALAATLAGRAPFPRADAAAHAAMHDALAPFLHQTPARPRLPAPAPITAAPITAAPITAAPITVAPITVASAPAAPRRRELPARHAGTTQKVTLGGHRLFLRTGEHEDGTLGEIGITLPKEGPAFRGLMEAFTQAVSLGLQHGVPLEEFVDTFIQTRFGPAGAVEGDPSVTRATSVLDYAFRALAARYLGRTDLPDAPVEEPAEAEASPPLLPLDLPRGETQRRRLRVVK